jgi:L-serine dehydratase
MQTILDFFKIGIGPSSSHTTGPMLASKKFVSFLKQQKKFGEVEFIKVNLYGSLALTGKGHGTPIAIKLGLMNILPEDVTTKQLKTAKEKFSNIKLGGIKKIDFNDDTDIIFKNKFLKYHANGMK